MSIKAEVFVTSFIMGIIAGMAICMFLSATFAHADRYDLQDYNAPRPAIEEYRPYSDRSPVLEAVPPILPYIPGPCPR